LTWLEPRQRSCMRAFILSLLWGHGPGVLPSLRCMRWVAAMFLSAQTFLPFENLCSSRFASSLPPSSSTWSSCFPRRKGCPSCFLPSFLISDTTNFGPGPPSVSAVPTCVNYLIDSPLPATMDEHCLHYIFCTFDELR